MRVPVIDKRDFSFVNQFFEVGCWTRVLHFCWKDENKNSGIRCATPNGAPQQLDVYRIPCEALILLELSYSTF